MPGMMQEAEQLAAQTSSGPPAQTPPVTATPQSGAPGSEQPSPLGAVPVEQEDPQVSNQPSQELDRTLPPFPQLRDEAIQMVYDERYEQLIAMFEKNGAEKFPRSMAIAINTPITELEKKYSKMPYEEATKVALALYTRLLEDIVGEGIVEGLTPELVADAIPATLMMFSSSHPEVTKEQLQQVMVGAKDALQQGGAEQQAIPGIEEIFGGNAPPPQGAAPPQEAPAQEGY